MKKKNYLLSIIFILIIGAVFVKEVAQAKDADLQTMVEAVDHVQSSFGPMCSKTGRPGLYYMKICTDCRGSFGKYEMDIVAFCTN